MNELTLNKTLELKARLDAESRGHDSIFAGLTANGGTIGDKKIAVQPSPETAGGPVAPISAPPAISTNSKTT